MATLVLTAVGTAIGGPLGGLVGSFLGASIDRKVFGGSRKGSAARSADLAVQSSAYGEPMIRCYGRMRIAGNLIWSPGIKERSAQSGGKHGAASTGYSYSCSFAVALSARPIAGVGRIWADGKLLRNADGSYNFPATMRLHLGSDGQQPDTLIAAVEGVANAPAYRGQAYAVFENLPLADYANRIPNLTFEVIADLADIAVTDIVADLCAAAGVSPSAASGDSARVHGYAATQAGNLRRQLEPLVLLSDLSFAAVDGVLRLQSGAESAIAEVAPEYFGTTAAGGPSAARQSDTRAPLASVADAIAIGFYDPARDFQLGLQRASRRQPAERIDQHDLAVALDATAAKAVATQLLGEAIAARSTAEVRVPWRYAATPVGATIQHAGDSRPWRIRGISIENMLLHWSVERLPLAVRALITADGGRALAVQDQPNGPTTLHVLDLPPLAGPLPVAPRLWLAANGTSEKWRRAHIEYSLDGGSSYAALAAISTGAVIGSAISELPPGPSDRWDSRNMVDVELINDALWLESREPGAVLAGANLALLGDELIQFAAATALGARRFRLTNLLRGRRASAGAMASHVVGERFVLLEAERLVAFDPPIDASGRFIRLRASSFGTVASEIVVQLRGRALRPLAPSHLAANLTPEGDVLVEWIRRSRAGFDWPDATDVALAEENEAYRIEIWSDGALLRTANVNQSHWIYTAADRAGDGVAGSGEIVVRVAQLSAAIGIGDTAEVRLTL